MQIEPARHPVSADDAPWRRDDLFSRMSDVELLAELRCIATWAVRREDRHTAERAGEFFAAMYEYRTQARVPDWLWETTRAFVRQHAG